MTDQTRYVSHAIIHQESRLLLQLRDNRPDILHPNQWGLFGGSVDPGETPAQALKRELQEELGWMPPEPNYLMLIEDEEIGRPLVTYYFSVPLTVTTDQIRLTEGQAFGLFHLDELTEIPLIPKIWRLLPKVVELIASPALTEAWQTLTKS